MSERTEVSFDAALMMALRADAQKELDELPSPAQLKERYPDTSRWDARLQAALHKRRPVLKRVLIAVLTLVILTLGALAVSAEFRRAVYTMIQKFLPIEMQLTYQMDGEPLEQLPNGYSDHYVPDGFERDYEQGYDNEISFLHAYVDANDKSIFYYVDCSVIQDYGQIETFDNEHTVYERIKVGTADATLGTNNSGGRTGYVLVWEKDGISHTIIGKISREELLRIAEIISILSKELNSEWTNGVTCLMVENSDSYIPVIVHHNKNELIVEVGEQDKKIYRIGRNELNKTS